MHSTPTKRSRRHHGPDIKRQVVLACQQPGASVAAVALAHGLNANLVRRWLQHERKAPGPLSVISTSSHAFVEVPMPVANTAAAECHLSGASTDELPWRKLALSAIWCMATVEAMAADITLRMIVTKSLQALDTLALIGAQGLDG